MSQKFLLLLMSRVCLFIIFTTIQVFADSWSLPKPTKFYSPNGKYCLKVIPRKLKSQIDYWHDLDEGKENPGSPEGLKENYCKGILYKLDSSGKHREKWSIHLLNDVAPVSALVSSSGDYVVTFDNWHSVGYGDNVVVIYDHEGRLIKKFALDDFTSPEKLSKIRCSVSSRWWGGRHFIDEKNDILVLKISSGKQDYNLEKDFQEVKIDLKTGKVGTDPTLSAEIWGQSLLLTSRQYPECLMIPADRNLGDF